MSLTEDWKAGKLEKCKRYWVKTPVFLGEKPAFLCSDNSFDVDGTIYPNTYDLEVLALCDYEELQQLKEFVNLYSHETVVTKQLRQLLEECYPYINKEFERQTMAENYHKNKFVKPLELLNKLDAAIGESEE